MDLIELMKERFSCRKFTGAPVEAEKVDRILEAGRVAPTAHNSQPQKVFVLESRESLDKWTRCTTCHFNEQLVLLVCYDKTLSWKRSYDGEDSGFVDASIVLTHMMLEAQTLGVGSTWIMYFDPAAARKEFDLPEDLVPVGALAMGHPAPEARPSHLHGEKKPLEETVVRL